MAYFLSLEMMKRFKEKVERFEERMNVPKRQFALELLLQDMCSQQHKRKFSLNFLKRNLEERIAVMEALIGTLGRQAQVERELGANDLVALQGLIRINVGMLQDNLCSLKEEITQLRATIEVQTQVMAHQNYDVFCEWRELLR